MSDNIKPWSNSGLTETEEQLQKTQQLERDNVALLAGVLEQCMLNDKGSEREYVLRGKVEQLERENAELRSLLREAVTDYELLGGTCDGVESEDYIERVKTALGEGKS